MASNIPDAGPPRATLPWGPTQPLNQQSSGTLPSGLNQLNQQGQQHMTPTSTPVSFGQQGGQQGQQGQQSSGSFPFGQQGQQGQQQGQQGQQSSGSVPFGQQGQQGQQLSQQSQQSSGSFPFGQQGQQGGQQGQQSQQGLSSVSLGQQSQQGQKGQQGQGQGLSSFPFGQQGQQLGQQGQQSSGSFPFGQQGQQGGQQGQQSSGSFPFGQQGQQGGQQGQQGGQQGQGQGLSSFPFGQQGHQSQHSNQLLMPNQQAQQIQRQGLSSLPFGQQGQRQDQSSTQSNISGISGPMLPAHGLGGYQPQSLQGLSSVITQQSPATSSRGVLSNALPLGNVSSLSNVGQNKLLSGPAGTSADASTIHGNGQQPGSTKPINAFKSSGATEVTSSDVYTSVSTLHEQLINTLNNIGKDVDFRELQKSMFTHTNEIREFKTIVHKIMDDIKDLTERVDRLTNIEVHSKDDSVKDQTSIINDMNKLDTSDQLDHKVPVADAAANDVPVGPIVSEQ